jgi:hypothetical protein
LTQRSASETIDEVLTLDQLQKEEERLRLEEEMEVHRKRQEAQQLAVKRGLAPNQKALSTKSSTPRSLSPAHAMATVNSTVSPLVRTPAGETAPAADQSDSMPFPSFVDSQTMPDSSGFYVDESDYSSKAVTPNRPLSIKEEVREDRRGEDDDGEAFVPARLPNFGSE